MNDLIANRSRNPLASARGGCQTATQIGKQLGISANKVGKLTNAHNLKTDKYGMRGHSKQVETFRYYDNMIPVLKGILESEINI